MREIRMNEIPMPNADANANAEATLANVIPS